MHGQLIIFVSEGGAVRTHAVPMDEHYGVPQGSIETGVEKLFPEEPGFQKIVVGFVNEIIGRKRAVRLN
jgi:hypothetical protein